MLETVKVINICIIVHKVFVASIVRRVNVDYIDSTLMGFLQQPQRVEIIALQDEVVALTGCRSDFTLRYLREHRNMIPHHHIDCFFMLLPYKAILFGGQFTFDFTQGDEHIVIVSVLIFYLLQERQHSLPL